MRAMWIFAAVALAAWSGNALGQSALQESGSSQTSPIRLPEIKIDDTPPADDGADNDGIAPNSIPPEQAGSGQSALPPAPDGGLLPDGGTAQGSPGLDLSRMRFDAEAVRRVVKFHMPDIQKCYEKVLADTGQKIEGKVVVGFIVNPKGKVAEARTLKKKTTVLDVRIVDCVLQSVRTWTFPEPSDDRDHPIEYPFDLKVKR